MPINAVVISDHKIIRHGLKIALESDGTISVVGECDDVVEGGVLVKETKPDMVLVDLPTTAADGVFAIRHLSECSQKTRILTLMSGYNAQSIKRLKDAGAMGCLTKDADIQDYAVAAKTIAKGEFYLQTEVAARAFFELLNETSSKSSLSDREIDVIRLYSQGHEEDEVSTLLNITARTVQTHLYHAMKKLGLHSRNELIQYAIKEGLIPTPEKRI